MELVTLGMFIIDEIHYPPPKPPSLNILGGAGSYAVLGARLFRPTPDSRKVGWVVHKGSDFPLEITKEIQSWDTTCEFQETPGRNTTRGWNGYGEDERRDFRYLTEKMRVDHTQLTKALLRSQAFHLICTPTRCINLIDGILSERKQSFAHDESIGRPIIVWEPVPDACGPEELRQLIKALEYVDVVSPNHHELAALFAGKVKKARIESDMEQMKEQCDELFKQGFRSRKGAVAVRCGENGCYLRAGRNGFMFPAYHQSASSGRGEPSKVVDPTGAGNAFLGAFAIGMLDAPSPADKLKNGVLYGTVAASFAVEQVGLPKLKLVEGEEFWNGEEVKGRLQALKDRLKTEVGAPEAD